MHTFIDLYNFLQQSNFKNITEWLEIKDWYGKEKQESIFRLFSKLRLIDKIEKYKICIGNFNLQYIKPITKNREIFYDEKNREIYLNE